MSAAFAPPAIAALKSITIRLSTSNPEQLPQVAVQSSKLLWDCRELLSTPADVLKGNSEVSVLVHKFRTHLSTLLQDRSPHGRWAAVVLTKAALEAGGLETLSKSNAWVRPLLGILKKPDPPTTRSLTVLTLTRVFMLTRNHTNLVREITTPALPAFISTCLTNAHHPRCSSKELETILESFATLIARHPTVFRTHESQIRALVLDILSSKNEGHAPYHNGTVKEAARHLLVLLHHCAPKQGATEKWQQLLHSTISAAHSTCDRLSRSLLSDWQSTADVQSSVPSNQLVSGESELEHDAHLGLKGWRGVDEGVERIVSLLDIVGQHLEMSTNASVTVPIGHIFDLISRICSITTSSRPNNEVSRDEREAFVLHLPQLHAAAIQLATTLVRRFGRVLTSLVSSLLAALSDITSVAFEHAVVRQTAYGLFRNIVSLFGPTMTRAEVAESETIIAACCADLLTESEQTQSIQDHVPFTNSSAKLGGKGYATADDRTPGLIATASTLLPVLLANIHPAMLSPRVRAQMDRTAVLTRNKDALVASVLNPARERSGRSMQASVLPLLARQFPDCVEVEALIRPRMPVIRTGKPHDIESDDVADDNDMDVDEHIAQQLGVGSATKEPMSSVSAMSQQEVGLPNGHASDGRREDYHAAEKRLAMDESRHIETRQTKRPRPSPPAERSETLPPADDQHNLPPMYSTLPLNQPTIEAAPPTSSAATYTTAASQQTAVATVAEQVSSAVSDPILATNVDDEFDDGSDFELPPLTMEQDTASEGEDDD